jgi:type II secretory pathway pseudopilin PulG
MTIEKIEGAIMKSETTILRSCAKSNLGFSLLEALISLAIIGVIGVLIFSFQTSTWKMVTSSNHTIVAGHMIEKQIESIRMNIDQNPTANFPPAGGWVTGNGVTLTWTISPAARPTDGGPLSNVRKCDFIAGWGSGKSDTLTVSTYLAKKF